MTPHGDEVPLGISGLITVPRTRGVDSTVAQFLYTDEDRVRCLAARLERQLDSPLIAPGSGAIARRILNRFPTDPRPHFANKLLLTVRDGEMHSMVAKSGADKPVAVCFVSWRGTWRELISKRYGAYLDGFFNWVGLLNAGGAGVTAFLQVDAFIRETVNTAEPLRPLEDCITLDVEYTYLPGYFFGQQQADETVPRAVVLNADLLSDEQKRKLAPVLGG
jgi:hypothetical protein